ncbi:MAG: L,D-transpeptidase family protein [Novosphingobium sp.]|nr:L,D-transpeptidase family protein [Novosphingobium sp.]
MASTVARTITGVGLLALASIPAMAQPGNAVDQATAPKAPTKAVANPAPVAAKEAAPKLVTEPIMHWTMADAAVLLSVIEGIESEGLVPADYRPDLLRAAMARGENDALDYTASNSFSWLAEDLRDGRTPMKARVQWFVVDPDQDDMPTDKLLADALTRHDVAGVLASLAPTHRDYAALKQALAETPPANKARRALIQANMDRWRWLRHDLGEMYLLTNVPEFQLRFTVKGKIIRSYRTVVGKPGRTATPQLAETITSVVFNPTWTVPQSIVKGEGLGARLLANPASAKAQGYKVSKAANGVITVVQQPGGSNALGLMKIDMPNPHAIYLHDTPSKQYFNHEVRAYSHGCIRTENAVELGMTLAILGAKMPPAEAVQTKLSKKYTRVQMERTVPVYLTYFTMAQDIEGGLRQFSDIYGRDAPVLASFAAPRQTKTTQRTSDEEIIKLDNPL